MSKTVSRVAKHIPGETKCTCSIRYMETEGELMPEHAQIDFCPLHSAAPDMLEALKWCVKNLAPSIPRETFPKCVAKVEQVIARAKGK